MIETCVEAGMGKEEVIELLARKGVDARVTDIVWNKLEAENPEFFLNVPEDKAQAIMRVDEPFKNIRLYKPWVLTLFPTKGFADLEGMSLEDYTRVIVNASIVDPRLLEEVEEDIDVARSKPA